MPYCFAGSLDDLPDLQEEQLLQEAAAAAAAAARWPESVEPRGTDRCRRRQSIGLGKQQLGVVFQRRSDRLSDEPPQLREPVVGSDHPVAAPAPSQ